MVCANGLVELAVAASVQSVTGVLSRHEASQGRATQRLGVVERCPLSTSKSHQNHRRGISQTRPMNTLKRLCLGPIPGCHQQTRRKPGVAGELRFGNQFGDSCFEFGCFGNRMSAWIRRAAERMNPYPHTDCLVAVPSSLTSADLIRELVAFGDQGSSAQVTQLVSEVNRSGY